MPWDIQGGTGGGSGGGGTFISVATRGALIALSTAGLLLGQPAYVQSPKTYWSYDPTSTTPANGTTVLLASGGGRWIDNTPALVISPLQYGAVGNNVADDTAAVQSAAADAIASGAILQLDAQFKTTAPLDLSGAQNLIVRGVGGLSGLYPSFAGGAAIKTNATNFVHLSDFILDGSGGTCADGLLFTDSTSIDVDISIRGGGVGFTRAGITIAALVANCYAIHVGGDALIDRCAGDSYQILPGQSHAALSIGPGAVFQDAGGWNLNGNSGFGSPSQMTAIGFVFQGGALGEMTGSWWGSYFEGHLETVGNNVSSFVLSAAQSYRGLTVACFIENHSTGTGYCMNLATTHTSIGLVCAGSFFDLSPTAAIFCNGAFVNGTIGPNDYNGTYFAGTTSSSLTILDAARTTEQQGILRTYAPGGAGMVEISSQGIQSTSGATPSTVTLSFPVAAGNIAPAAFSGCAVFELTVTGRDTTSADCYYAKLRILISNRAGVVTFGVAGLTVVDQDSIGGGSGATLPTVVASGTPGNIDVGLKGWTIAGAPPIDWTVAYHEVNRP